MNQESSDRRRRTWIRWGIGLAAAAAVAGGVFTVALPASADPSTPPSSGASAAPGGQPQGGAGRTGETVLTGADADKATAAALKAVPGATINRVETDADGAVYEAHLTKADGTKSTVKFDKDFNVTSIEAGMGTTK